MELFNFDENFVAFSLKQLYWGAQATRRHMSNGDPRETVNDVLNTIRKTCK